MNVIESVLRVIHVVNAVLMAWPFYALVLVNQRARLGSPLGDRADMYLENIIKNRTVPCFVFQATALVTGLAMVLVSGLGIGALLTHPALGVKLLLLLLIGGLLAYVNWGVQPRLDALFAQAGSPVPAETAAQIGRLRLWRKRIASTCLFVVLTNTMLGVQAWVAFPAWLTLVLVAAITLFVWRAFRSLTSYGWA